MKLRLVAAAAAMLLAVTDAAGAGAKILPFSFTNVTYADASDSGGGTLTGSFAFDTVANTIAAISIQSSASPQVPSTLFDIQDPAYNYIPGYVVATDSSDSIELNLQLASDLPTSGGIKDAVEYVAICTGHQGGSCQYSADYLTAMVYSPPGEYVEATAVPEPTSWATMVLGIGLTGGTLRVLRRRKEAGLTTI